jgi:eukaryotic-like serine/threonine-protein kinase
MGGDLMAQQWDVPGYTEVKALGSGGFGDVVLARRSMSGTLVAIKYLRRELLADPEFAVMFRGEAEVLASVEDPNVVRLYEYVQSPAGAAIVMELVEGVCLREILARQGQTTAEAALVVLQGSLLGLAAAHRRGVVHRDYKAENVLVNGQGASKLTDFGIAARAGDRAMAAGTLAYAPPEQFGGGPASPSGDVYAATATFYECLTGHPPFRGDSAERLLYQHLAEAVPLEPVPEPLRPLIEAGMAKDPGRRPADATILVAELRTVAAGTYGPDWEDRGRSGLAAAALLLAALWPAGGPAAVQGTAVRRISLRRHLPHGNVSAVKAAVTAGVVIAGIAVAVAVIVVRPTGHTTGAPAPIPARATTPAPIQTDWAELHFSAAGTSYNPYENVIGPGNVSGLTQAWAGNLFPPGAAYLGPADSSPVIADGIAYLGSFYGHLYAFSAAGCTGTTKTCQPLWSYPAINGMTVTTPAVAGSVIHVAEGADLYAFSATGTTNCSGTPKACQLLWTADFWPGGAGTNGESSPTVAGGIVYVGSPNGNLYAFNATSGKLLWTATYDPGGVGNVALSSPAVANGIVYIGSENGPRLYAFNATSGKLLWTEATAPGSAPSDTAVAGGVVYMTSGYLYAFNATSGTPLWRTANIGSPSYIAVAGGEIYVSGGNVGGLYAFSAAGSLLWTRTPGSVSTPAIANGVVYVGSGTVLEAYQATSGQLLWTSPTIGSIGAAARWRWPTALCTSRRQSAEDSTCTRSAPEQRQPSRRCRRIAGLPAPSAAGAEASAPALSARAPGGRARPLPQRAALPTRHRRDQAHHRRDRPPRTPGQAVRRRADHLRPPRLLPALVPVAPPPRGPRPVAPLQHPAPGRGSHLTPGDRKEVTRCNRRPRRITSQAAI